MYILWSRGSDLLSFPMDYDSSANETSDRSKRDEHRHLHLHSPHHQSENGGLVMAQLLRADKLVIPER